MYRSLILTLTFIAIIGYRYLVGYEEPLDNLWHRWNYLFSSTVTSTIEKDASSPKLMEADMTVPEIIKSRGYPVEIHQVTTQDGYILEIHRIPHGRFGSVHPNERKKAVLLQHGLCSTGHVFVINHTNRSLGFLLADHGYDVWLLNSRGSTYSRKHVVLDPRNDRQFWNFTWTEMGSYDVTASIDYVLNTTKSEKLSLVGHSLGCALSYIAMIEQPQYNDKIDVIISLAPSTNFQHSDSIFRILSPFTNLLQVFFEWMGVLCLYDNDVLIHRMLRCICHSGEIGNTFCRYVVFSIFGSSYDYEQSAVETTIGHYPSGTSLPCFGQYLQNLISGERFLRYDFGLKGNMERYGKPVPDHYNLSLVTAPVYILWANNDIVSPPQDVAWTTANLGNLKASFQVENPSFSHGDFIWGNGAAQLFIHPLIRLLNNM